MDDAAYYRSEAESFRQLAARAPSTVMMARLLKLAMENEVLADAMSGVPTVVGQLQSGRRLSR